MSLSAAHEPKKIHRACESCLFRKARFQRRGRVRSDRDHTLCFECYRSERERGRARLLADLSAVTLRSPMAPMLTERQLAHRRRMLEYALNEVSRAANR